MKIFIFTTIVAVLSFIEFTTGLENDGLSQKELKLSRLFTDLDVDGFPEGLSALASSSSKIITLKPVKIVRGLGGGSGKRRGGRRRKGGRRGRKGGGGGGGHGNYHFSGRRLPLPSPKVLFGSGYGKMHAINIKGLGLGAGGGHGGGGYGGGLELGGGYGGGHGGSYGGGLGGGLKLGGGGGHGGGLGGGYGGGHGGGISLKGLDYETLFDGDSHSGGQLSIGLGDVQGDVYLENYKDGEVISCQEYDGGYEYGGGGGGGGNHY